MLQRSSRDEKTKKHETQKNTLVTTLEEYRPFSNPVFSQNIYPDYQDGKIYFKIKDNVQADALRYVSSEGEIKASGFEWLNDVCHCDVILEPK